MADLSGSEKRRLEKRFDMRSGYVLNFSNRTFAEFIEESTGRDIDSETYNYSSGSKAHRLRGFWKEEDNYLVGKLIGDLLAYGIEEGLFGDNEELVADCRSIVVRLIQGGMVPDLDALTAPSNERDFEIVAKAVRDAIENNAPESGLDRLHTFVVKYVRSLCNNIGITVTLEKPLHSLIGEVVKSLKNGGHIESMMTERILKSSISTMEAFNSVRNNQSLAHDNTVLNYDEALLIFNHVASSIRFLRSIESRLGG